MRNFVYLVYDYSDNKEVIAVCGTSNSARRVLMEYLEEALGEDDWRERAEIIGYEGSVEEFKEMVRQHDYYDYDLEVGIETEAIIF